MDGPPPPPPPHGENPHTTEGEYRKASDLPPGNYDIFIVPPHSAGAGFVYLPSLQCNRNSFLAGVASTLAVVYVWSMVAPTLKTWWVATVSSQSNKGVVVVALVIAVAGWAFGMSQSGYFKGSSEGPDGKRPPGDGFGGFGSFGGSSGQSSQGHSSGPGHGNGHQNHQRGGSTGSNHQQGQHGGNYGGGSNHGQQYAGNQRAGSAPEADTAPPPPPPPKPEPTNHGPNGDEWEKAREETRRKEELRRKMEEFKRKREAEAKEKERKREREAMEKELRERREQLEREMAAAREKAEREAREKAEMEAKLAREKAEKEAKETREKAEKEAKEARLRAARELSEARAKAAKAAAEAKAEAERLEAEAKAEKARREAEAAKLEAEAKEKAAKEAAEKAAAEKAAAQKEAMAKFAALKEAAAKRYAEKKAQESQKETPTASKAGSTKSAQTAPRTPSPKKPPFPTAKTTLDDDAYSFRPYDRPRRPYGQASGSSAYSESSYAPSQSTARTTPPPSHRVSYSTKDPDKIVILGVYQFTNAFMKTPVAQLVSGQGMVTDGLVLRITTEGLFVDDDLRGVGQREWDVKAWTLKLTEVWCPQMATSSSSKQPASTNPFYFRRSTHSVPTSEESDAFITNLLKVCKNTCRLAAPAAGAVSRGLHVLRASLRDQEGKRYVFVLQDTEAWKVAIGLERLRGGALVRALGATAMAASDCKTILNNLGFT
ncbi:Uncharacterized protein PECH_004765 [Penicillium ucsense]|uniref:Trans-sialidase n=1 Tax=Penicillium ucsense TaxID=2839758 RepID=A0A8J8WN70_9EURO|nr:Uncharacterized protein PECM_007599 [Penicillium ucsense]KAF7739288.1 Uncharacterized protein PECH_004765 [Penicillium ucsense]